MGEGDSPRGSPQWAPSDKDESASDPDQADCKDQEMDAEDELAGSGADLDDEDIDSVEGGEGDPVDNEEDAMEAPDAGDDDPQEDDDDDELTGNSECYVEYNRQYYMVPNAAKVRDHHRPHVVATPEILGEMASSNSASTKWPKAEEIDPASVVVLEGKLKEDDASLHNVWYLRITVENRTDGVDGDILRHIPKGVVKDLLQQMGKDDTLCESSLVLKYQPTNNNDKVLVPSTKVNNWDLSPTPPKSIAVKPVGVGAKRAQAPVPDKENQSSAPKKSAAPAPAPEPAPVATPPTKADGKKAVPPPAPKKASVAASSATKVQAKAAKPPAPKTGGNPFDKAKQVKPGKVDTSAPAQAPAPAPVPLTTRESEMVGEPEPATAEPQDAYTIIQKKFDEMIDKVPDGGRCDPETNAMMAAADALRPAPQQDREVEMTVKVLHQIRGGRDDTPRHGEVTNRTLEWVCKSRESGTAVVQKVLVPEWAKSYQLTLELSSEPQA